MAPPCRWLQFSLRGFFVALTIGGVGLGCYCWASAKIKIQREAVAAIEAIGGVLQYDWQPDPANWTIERRRRFAPSDTFTKSPTWLREAFGDELFQEVHGVLLNTWCGPQQRFWGFAFDSGEQRPTSESDLMAIIPYLKALPALETIYLEEPEHIFAGKPTNDDLESALKEALPRCRIVRDNVFTVRSSPVLALDLD